MDSIEKKFAEIQVGDRADFIFDISGSLVDDFGRLSGDQNPLHMDETYAKTTVFGQRVVHGMFGGALVSRLIGMYLPGKYALFLKETLTFRKPMFIGMRVLVEGVVASKTNATQTIDIAVKVKHDDEVLVDGQALVRVTQ